jgi:hypothetical protein
VPPTAGKAAPSWTAAFSAVNADPGGLLDQAAQRPQMPGAGGDRHARTSRRQDPAQLADRGPAIRNEIEQVRREHQVEGAITDGQRGHIGIDQCRVRDPAEHAERQITPGGTHPPLL